MMSIAMTKLFEEELKKKKKRHQTLLQAVVAYRKPTFRA
jgi:hypothetical protein